MTRSHGDSRRKEREFLLKIGPAIDHALNRKNVESPIKKRGADVHAGFLFWHIRPDMTVSIAGVGPSRSMDAERAA
jgi:hypothetical protein